VGREELRLSFLASVISFYNEYVDFLVVHQRQQEALRVAELSRARTLAEGLGKADSVSPNFRPQQLARRLQSILLFYWIGPEHSYVWVIAPQKTTCVPLSEKSEIDPALQSYRKAVVSGEDVLGVGNPNGKKLYEVLVAPIQKLVPGNSRVVVVPSDNLYALNFETLIVPTPEPHYWIEDVTLSTAGSLTLLAGATRRPSGGKRSLLLLGNAESPGKDFPPLPQSEAEMQKVSAHFTAGQRKVLEGKQATPSAYLASDPRQFSYMHFVTHGTASLTRPLESAVILSREGDSYKLYARDIVAHPLDAQLVTISACNGAGTRAYAGEGLVGLSWAFLRAGAHNVIASLWEVSDASSTAQLMDKLYQGLDQSEDPAVALRNAKLFILHANAGNVFRKPFYWAPFQLYAGS
jgi:CHAT domain-containing protein